MSHQRFNPWFRSGVRPNRLFIAVGLMSAVICGATGFANPPEPGAYPVGITTDTGGSGVRKLEFASSEAAAQAADQCAHALNGVVLRTTGTPSMVPFIPARSTYVVVAKPSFDTLKRSDLLVYMGRLNARRAERTCTLHRAVAHDRLGWLMSGDHNRWTESWDRVTPETYIGKVVLVLDVLPAAALAQTRARARTAVGLMTKVSAH